MRASQFSVLLLSLLIASSASAVTILPGDLVVSANGQLIHIALATREKTVIASGGGDFAFSPNDPQTLYVETGESIPGKHP